MSTPIEKKIEQIGEKFDELIESTCGDVRSDYAKRIKSFLNTALLELLEVVWEQIENEPTIFVTKLKEGEKYISLSDIKEVLKVKPEEK